MSKHVCFLTIVAAIAPLVAVCGWSTNETTIENDGQVCLRNESANISDGLQSGQTTVRVSFDTCLSSSCDTVVSKSCSAKHDGSTIEVTSRAVIESDTTGACTDDCGIVEVTCDGPELSDGDYTLQHGGETADFTVPSSGEVCGAGTGPGARHQK